VTTTRIVEFLFLECPELFVRCIIKLLIMVLLSSTSDKNLIGLLKRLLKTVQVHLKYFGQSSFVQQEINKFYKNV